MDKKEIIINKPEKLSKIGKIMEYYTNKIYGKLKHKEKVENRKVYIDLIIKYITYHNRRSEYKIYIRPKNGLPEIQINNQGVFFLFCTIHGFIPILDRIIIVNSGKKIDLTDYKDLVILNRLFHLFFITGFNFVTYDAIFQILKNNKIKEIFQSNDIEILNSSEFLSLVTTLEDIKKTGFDIHKHHFNKNLGKLNNGAIVTENIFLEIAMKYENKIREILGFEHTYIKPASFEDDTNKKTDFIWIWSNKKKTNKFNQMPIQLTLVNGGDKFEKFKHFFGKSEYNEIIYISINGKIKENLPEIEKIYFNWAENPIFRESKNSDKFPFFINEIPEYITEFVITYFYLHQILKHKNSNNIPKINFEINGINLNNIKIEQIKEKEKNIDIIEYKLSLDKKHICNIKILKNIGIKYKNLPKNA